MDWKNFSKQKPKDTGYYVTYCQGVNIPCVYAICLWDGSNFIGVTNHSVYPISVSNGGQVIQSCSVAYYSELTVPPQA